MERRNERPDGRCLFVVHGGLIEFYKGGRWRILGWTRLSGCFFGEVGWFSDHHQSTNLDLPHCKHIMYA